MRILKYYSCILGRIGVLHYKASLTIINIVVFKCALEISKTKDVKQQLDESIQMDSYRVTQVESKDCVITSLFCIVHVNVLYSITINFHE